MQGPPQMLSGSSGIRLRLSLIVQKICPSALLFGDSIAFLLMTIYSLKKFVT
jgi:hypothetical protein